MTNQAIALLRRAMLRHTPARHGIMQSKATHDATGRKYYEQATKPTTAQLVAHLAGEVTLAAPATANDLAACIVLDVDAEAMTRVPLLIKAANEQNLWSWGEIHEERNRGYVHIPFAQLGSAAQLKAVGDTLITAADLSHIPADQLDNRTMNQAITRLPFGVHTWTGQRGLLVFPDGISYDLNQTLETGLAAWCERYTENPPPVALTAPPAASQTAPAPRRATKRAYYDYTYSPAVVQQMFNERYDVWTILANHHARRGSGTSWHCPCGNHQHGDRHASLHIKAARNPKYGRYIVQGFSPACRFFSDPTRTYDAFNMYAALNGLSNAEMLKHARQELGLTSDRPNQAPDPETHDHHQRRRAPRAAQPPVPTIAVAQVRQDALQAFLRDHALTSSARRVYTHLYSSTEGLTCRPSIARIAAETGMHERTVQRAMRLLEQRGHIRTNHTENEFGDQTSIYTISVPPAILPPDINIKACKGGALLPASAAPPAVNLAPVAVAPPAAAPAPSRDTPPLTCLPGRRSDRFGLAGRRGSAHGCDLVRVCGRRSLLPS
jgi:Fe2+ or Zn2+ uptake regulation protein